MPIAVFCISCKRELDSPGGLIFSPYSLVDGNKVDKFHICRLCWYLLAEWLKIDES